MVYYVLFSEPDEDAPLSVEEENNKEVGVPVFPNAQIQPQQTSPACELVFILCITHIVIYAALNCLCIE